ncbi:uncharacterized protein B0H18DRAFT_1116412 [Fomitopsis serialis]|uniref:uncharacterized protein n=1 Tax=Fomitopsis serialis TaxID=139415 RepID=UPI002008D1E1|nr:uncharacterized protein B0H18DRAFT_1116412 [Neoantrodia serialis]KAH9931249.1 hypothetical protein B0H18DRAFT_1116412 [Neoantrodia serialis]
MSRYDAAVLKDEVALEVAMGDLENNLARTANVDGIVEDLLSIPCLLEFALASLSDTAAHKLSDGIFEALPIEASLFSASLGCRVLQRLSLFFVFLSYPSPADIPDGILMEHHSVERAKRLLHILAQHLFESSGRTGGPVRGSKKQKAKQQVQRPAPMPTLDSKVFNDLGIEVPSNRNEALAVAASVIETQRHLLQTLTPRRPLKRIARLQRAHSAVSWKVMVQPTRSLMEWDGMGRPRPTATVSWKVIKSAERKAGKAAQGGQGGAWDDWLPQTFSPS